MKEFNKSVKLEHVAYDIRGPVLEEAMRMRANGERILRLNTGNPAEFGFTAPDEVIHDLIINARSSEGYSDSKGLFSARKAIMQYCQLKHIPDVGIEDIYLGNGVSELIVMSMQGLLDDGDEVLVPMPDYPLWTAAVSLAGGNAVHYLCDEQADWYPDMDDIRSKITSNTKAIVVINPNNPTGSLYPKEVLEDIVEIARQNDLIIFADEIYDRLVMDGEKHTAIASLAPDLFCVSMNGLSKSHRIAGFRVGWMALSGPKKHVQGYIEGLNMLSMYVWLDALSNYITVIGYPDRADEWQAFWPADVQVIGKDILRFHAGIWPAMLMALDLPLPKVLLVHGFINVGGTKMSKSLGNGVGPADIIPHYGVEAFRYYFLRHVPTQDDGDFTYTTFVNS